jgi:hypothetical protein
VSRQKYFPPNWAPMPMFCDILSSSASSFISRNA